MSAAVLPGARKARRLLDLDRLQRLVLGFLPADLPERSAQREASIIADHVLSLIEREVDWVRRGVQPWRKASAADLAEKSEVQ